jgi:hypothetical protein
VRGADGDGMKGQEYFFFFRVGQDNLGPVVVTSSPAAGERNVDPTSEVRITMSETILASTVNTTTITVTFQPAGAAAPITVPGTWYTDGGNGPGNNYPNIQLDLNGNAGFTGTSPRNGVDLVFRPDLTAFPVNMTAEDPYDPFCTAITDPPRKGNTGFPLGQAITVAFTQVGIGVTDTAGNEVPDGSPGTSFTFETRPNPAPVFAPSANAAVYYGDTIGVGVIDVDPSRTPYFGGPSPARQPNSVVTSGVGPAQTVVRVPIPDLVDMTTDTRPYTSFYNFICSTAGAVRFYMGNLYAVSGSVGGGEVVVIDTFEMVPMGRFGTPSPGGVALTALGTVGRLVVSNFSANTVTVFDIGQVDWYHGSTNLYQTQAGLANAIATGADQLILSEEDFERQFPAQRASVASPPGPPVIGTINVGVSPGKVEITGLPNSLGLYAPPVCYSPILSSNTIVCALNAGENTADFSELTNLSQSASIEPDLRGLNLASTPTDATWSPFSLVTRSYYFYIASVGGSLELFASGSIAGYPAVTEQAANNIAPNKIINNVGGFKQPTAVQWIPRGNAVGSNNGYTSAVLVAETGQNRIQQVGVTGEVGPIVGVSNIFQVTNTNLSAGLGPVDITGEPQAVLFNIPCTPSFTQYYVANAGEGTVHTASYVGGVIGADIPVPGVLLVASWWSR